MEYLRAIVLVGEALNSGMNQMREVLMESFEFIPKYHSKLRMSLDPQFVLAFGAARRARDFIQNPHLLDPGDPGIIIGDPNGHNEL